MIVSYYGLMGMPVYKKEKRVKVCLLKCLKYSGGHDVRPCVVSKTCYNHNLRLSGIIMKKKKRTFADAIDSTFDLFGHSVKQSIADYCDLETADMGGSNNTLVSKDGSLLSIIEIFGVRRLVGGSTFLEQVVEPLASKMDTLLQESGRSLQFWFEVDPDETRAEVERILNPSRLTAKRLGLDMDDLISDRAILRNARNRGIRTAAKEMSLDFDNIPVGRVRHVAGGIGKFGWKAQFATLDEFVAAAYANELGLGTPTTEQAKPLGNSNANANADLDKKQFRSLVAFVKTLPKPVEVEAQRARMGATFAASFIRFRGGDYRVCLTVPQWAVYQREVM